MFLIFDTETTGLPRSYSAPLTDFDNWPRMVQVAWQLHDAQGNLINSNSIISTTSLLVMFSDLSLKMKL